MAALPYRIVDVFTDLPFRGNPLAVVLDAGDLADTQLAALAREFNLSETAFPVAADHSEADYRLRIFMPGKELPFAGHPSVGAAWVMATDGRVGVSPPTSTIVQSCGAGLLPLHVAVGPAGDIGPVELAGGTPSAGDPLDPSATLAAIGLDAADLTAGRAFRVCSTGLPQAILCVRDEALGRMRVNPGALGEALGESMLCVLSWDSAESTAHARVMAAGLGWGEDPATGSAATALGAWLAAEGLTPVDGDMSYEVRQGAEIGRPSLLRGTVVSNAGRAVECRVAGRVVPVAEGRIEIPQ